MTTRICVLRSGGEYKPEHVQLLSKQIPCLVCLSDVPVEGVKTIPLSQNWPGWWSKLELFRPDIEGDLLYFDLDTVVLGAVDELEVGETTMLSDFFRPQLLASGLMYISERDKSHVWTEFTKSPIQHIRRCTTRHSWGDQGFLSGVLSPKRWQDLLPNKVVSYKVHCRYGLPDNALVVCFHGYPRPWQAKEGWVPKC